MLYEVITRPGFPDDAQKLARFQVKGDGIDGMNLTAASPENGFQPRDIEYRQRPIGHMATPQSVVFAALFRPLVLVARCRAQNLDRVLEILIRRASRFRCAP